MSRRAPAQEGDDLSRSVSEARRSGALLIEPQATRLIAAFRLPAILGRVGTPTTPSATMVPAHVARLVAYAALALLGVMQWQRLVAGLPAGRAILWVVVGVLGALAVLWASTRQRWPATLTLGATLASLLGAYAASGLPLHLLKPREWDDLVAGLWGGAEALGTVALPYEATDPWPALTLQLLGAMLCVLAALLAFWPREHGRGHLFLSLATLLVMVASPVVSIGGSNQVLLGAALAALTVCFLWLERLPRRSWIGLAVLGVAVAGAVPLAAAADGDSPWFDYRAWAEEFGPGTPVSFNWGHSYGPLDWPREGSEVLRVDARRRPTGRSRTSTNSTAPSGAPRTSRGSAGRWRTTSPTTTCSDRSGRSSCGSPCAGSRATRS